MDQNKVYFYSLLKDELVYEVSIRAEIPEDTVAKLRKQLKSLVTEFDPCDILDDEREFDGEFNVITDKLSELQTKLESFEKSHDHNLLIRARAIYCHLYYRINRLQVQNSAEKKSKAELDAKLLECLPRIQAGYTTRNDEEAVDENARQAVDFVGQQMVKVTEPSSSSQSPNIVKWNLKFDGRSNPRSFLEAVREHASAYGFDDSKLFRSAFCLFSEQGLLWYRGVKDQVSSWQELSDLLLEEFDPVDYDYRLLGEIRSRTQGADEPTHIYFAVMCCMFARLKAPLSESNKLEILMHNVRPCFSEHLALHDVQSIAELKEKCRKLESARQRSQMFTEPPKHSGLNPEFVYKGRSKVSVSVVEKKVTQSVQGKEEKKYCPRCKTETHSLVTCGADKIVKCFSCGELGYTRRTCPKCRNPNSSKN